jgi:hypothetical protein
MHESFGVSDVWCGHFNHTIASAPRPPAALVDADAERISLECDPRWEQILRIIEGAGHAVAV